MKKVYLIRHALREPYAGEWDGLTFYLGKRTFSFTGGNIDA